MTNHSGAGMSDDPRELLRAKVKGKLLLVTAEARSLARNSKWMMRVALLCSTTAAFVSYGPGIGGKSVTQPLAAALGTAPDASPAWRLFCVAAAIFSTVAAGVLALHGSEGTADKLTKAQVARAQLETLDISLDDPAHPYDKAKAEYDAIVKSIPTIH